MSKGKRIRRTPRSAPTKLDIGCGTVKQADHFGIDQFKFPGVDLVHDVRVTPWPFKAGSIHAIYSSHFVEHLTGPERVSFFNEVYRVLMVGGKATIITPHWSNACAYGDPTHQWPPMSEWCALYLDATWRKTQAPHTNAAQTGGVGYACDFEYVVGFSFDERAAAWNNERRMFGLGHHINAARDMHMTLTKRVMPKA